MSNLWPRAFARVFALALIHFPLAAQAQNDDEAIIITATRFEENRLSAPIGTRIITAEQISNSTARTVPEVLGTLGGAHVRNNTGSPDLQIDLRGFGITGDDNTLILLDGVRIEKTDLATRPLSAIPLDMIERIEILPGGGAVQYGAGATGGTINIITKTAKQGTRTFSAMAGLGSYDTHEYGGTLAVAEEQLGLMLNARRYDSDNYRENNDFEQSSVLGNLQWKGASSRAALRFGGSNQDLGLPGYRTATELHSDRRGAQTPFNTSSIETRFAILNAGVRGSDLEFETDVSHRTGENEADYVSYLSEYRAEYDTSIVSPRIRWSLPTWLGVSSQLVSGVEWHKTDFSAVSTGSFDSDADTTQESRAFYATWYANLGESTRFNYGWRVQRFEEERDDNPPSFLTGSTDERRTLYADEVALRQDFARYFSAHIKTARSFRIANADENFGLVATGSLLKPQTAKEREVGIQYQDKILRLSAVAFDIRLEDEIMFSPLAFANVNLPPTRRRGLELAGNWQIAKNLNLSGNISFLKATFRSGDFEGNDVPLVPKQLANVSLSWTPMDRTTLSAQFTFVGEHRNDNDQANTSPSKMPSYGIFGARINQEWNDWLLSASVDNLFDKDYYTYAITVPGGACSTFCAYPQAGRTLFVSAEYRFH